MEATSTTAVPAADAPATDAQQYPRQVAQVRASTLKAALPFAATNDIRYYLHAVSVMPPADGSRGVVVAATNGHMAVMMHDPEGEASSQVLISSQAVKAMPKSGKVLLIEEDATGKHTATLPAARLAFPDCSVAGKYPDLGRIVPNPADLKPGIQSVGFNAELLQEALATFPRVAGRVRGVEFWQESESGVLCIAQRQTEVSVLVVVMPMRTHNGDLVGHLDWIRGSAAAAEGGAQ